MLLREGSTLDQSGSLDTPNTSNGLRNKTSSKSGSTNHKRSGSSKLKEEQEAISQILKSRDPLEGTIGWRSKVISIARVGLKSKDSENTTPKKN